MEEQLGPSSYTCSLPQRSFYHSVPFILNTQGHPRSSLFECSPRISNALILGQKQNHKDSSLLRLLIHPFPHLFIQ